MSIRLLASLLTLILLAGCGKALPTVKDGSLAPAFETVFVDGRSLRFPADYAGQPVVLDFWADWCRYCPDSMQRLEQARRQHADTDLAIIAINVGQDAATATAFLEQLEVGYPAALDSARVISARYGVQGLPVSFFIDRNGRISGRILGGGDERTLAAQLARILH